MVRLATAVLSFLALFGIGACAAVPCPDAEDLDPCTCKQTASGLNIVCANFEDKDKLISAFEVLGDYELQNVLFSHLHLTGALPNDLFNDLEIEELRVENSDIEFSQSAFTGLEESLKKLSVFKSVVKTSPDNSVAKLVKLEELSVKEVALGKVSNELFNGKIPNVRTLILDDNEITDVESKAFAELEYLTKFSAAGNGITTVARSMGPSPGLYLESIDFSRNKISVLPDDSFADFPKLTTLKISANNLKTVSEKVWSGVWEKVDSVQLFDNDIVCDKDLDWLKNVKWPREVTGNCVLPTALVGKSLREVYKPEN